MGLAVPDRRDGGDRPRRGARRADPRRRGAAARREGGHRRARQDRNDHRGQAVGAARAELDDEAFRLGGIARAVQRTSPRARRSSTRPARAGSRSPMPQAFEALPGKGVTGTVAGRSVLVGNRVLMAERRVDVASLEPRAAALAAEGATPVFVAVDGRARRHPGGRRSGEAEQRRRGRSVLRQMRLDVVMLTGDDARTAEAVAAGWASSESWPRCCRTGNWRRSSDFRIRAGSSRWWATASTTLRRWRRRTSGSRSGPGTDVAVETGSVTLDARRSDRGAGRARARPPDDARDPPESVLGVRLQRDRHPDRGRCALPVRRPAAHAGAGRRRDGGELGERRDEQPSIETVAVRTSSKQ